MALISKLELETLNIVHQGQPFVQVATKTTSTANLDTVYQGQPFSATDPVAAGGVVQDFTVTMNSAVTVVSIATRVMSFDVLAMTLFSTGIIVNARLVTDVYVVGNFTVTADSQRNRAVTVTLDNIANLAAQADRIAGLDAGMDVSATLTADLTLVTSVDFSASLNTAFTVNAMANSFVRTTSPVIFLGVGKPDIDYTTKKFGSASLFLNGSSYLYAEDQSTRFDIPDTDTSAAGEFTKEFWIYPTQAPTTTAQFIVGQWQGNASSTQSWKVEYATSGNVSWTFRIATSTVATLTSSTNSINVNAWNHIVVVRSRNSATSATTALFVNGVRESTGTTRSAMWSGAGGQMRLGYSGETGTTYFRGYIDAFNFRNGNDLYPANDATIVSPSSEYSTPVTFDAILLNFNNDYLDQSYPKFVTAIAALNTAFTQTTSAIKATAADATLNSAFTQTAINQKIIDFDFAGADALFSMRADSTRVLSTAAELNANAIQSADNQRIRTTDATVNSNFALSADAIRILEFDFAGADAAFTQNTQANAIFDCDAGLDSVFSASIQEIRIRDTLVQFDSVATQLTAAAKIGQALAGLDVVFTQSTDAISTRVLEADLTVAVTQTAEANATREFSVSESSAFTLGALSEVSSGAIANLNANVNLTAEATRVITGDFAGADAAFELTAIGDIVLTANAALNSDFTVTALAQKTQGVSAALDVTAQLTAQAEKVSSSLAQLNSTVTVTVDVTVIRGASVTMTAFASEMTVGRVIKQFNAQLNSNFTVIASGLIIVLDADLTYKIPREVRSASVLEEMRTESIIGELKVYSILKENRTTKLSATEENYII